MTIAEESTAWPLVSRPTYVGGLGFTLKWNMGWMHDILEYFAHDPIHRRFHHKALTFSMMYAFSENFVLPFSHDEVVHLKGSMLNKMPGDAWQKFATLRALYTYMFAHPGKKLMFMGDEFGQWAEWNYAGWLQWYLLGPAGDAPSLHAQLQTLVRDLHALLRSSPALYEVDFEPTGFEWIDCNDADSSVISFLRMSADRQDMVIVVCNFTPVPRYGYRVGVPVAGNYTEVLNTDAAVYGGGNVGNMGSVVSEPIAAHGRTLSLSLTLPPLATLVLRPSKPAIASDAVRVTASALAHRDETKPTTTTVRDGTGGASARAAASARVRTSSRRRAERAADASAPPVARADDRPPQVRQRGRGATATPRTAQRPTRREASSAGALARRTRPTT